MNEVDILESKLGMETDGLVLFAIYDVDDERQI